MSLHNPSNVPLIPRAVLFGNPERTDPHISPDGARIAYLAPHDGVMNVWVRTVDQDDDRVVTSDTVRGIRQFYWQRDSAHILYLQDQNGDENFHLYQTDVQTQETRDLTPFPNVRARPLPLSHDYPDVCLVLLNVRNPQLHDVYRIDLVTGAATLDTENPGDVAGWQADHTLQVRAAQSTRPDGGQEVRVRDTPDAPWRTLLSWGPDESFGGVVSFTPDDRGLWLLSSLDAEATRLLEVDLATGARRVLVDDAPYEVSDLLIHPATQALQAAQITRARREWRVLDPDLQADFDRLLAFRDGDLTQIHRDYSDRLWIVGYILDDGPITYYTYERTTGEIALLFSSQPALDAYPLAKMRPISFPARDGLLLHGYLTLPVGAEPRGLPLVLLVHGGPWHRDSWGFEASVQWLANRGYAVLQINFRGSTGYGKAYLNAGNREWSGKMHTDLLDGKAWAIAEGIADPARVGIMGGSYGGYATLVGLAFTPEEFVCGVDIVGPSNLLTLLASFPPYWAPMVAMFKRRVGDPEVDEAFLKACSPLFIADRIKAPLLIAQGAHDPRVKQAESDQIVAAMRANGQPVEYIVFPDEGHGFARPENQRKFTAAAEQFLARYLGGPAEPAAPEEDVDALRR